MVLRDQLSRLEGPPHTEARTEIFIRHYPLEIAGDNSHDAGMSLSAKELNRRTLRLAQRVITKHTEDKGKPGRHWQRSELMAEGYSGLVVNKIEQYDMLDRCKTSAGVAFTQVILFLVVDGYLKLFFAAMLAIFVLEVVRYFKSKLSVAEDVLVYEELMGKLGAHNIGWDERPLLEPLNSRQDRRPLLWRLDAFLSGKRVSD